MIILAFLIAIGILVTVHELGHYVVARLCGVKVLCFSLGFGRPIFSFRWMDSEWLICMIPLGGYVKMLDEREAPVSKEELPLAFNTQSVFKRILIVAAGPLSNLLFALLISWIVLLCGEPRVFPFVGSVMPQTAAASAGFVSGDKIKSVNGNFVQDWQEINLLLVESNASVLKFDVVTADGKSTIRNIDLDKFYRKKPDVIDSLALGMFSQHFLPKINYVTPNSPAEKAGLKKGDELIRLDGVAIKNWESFAFFVRENPGQLIDLEIIRQSKPIKLQVRPKNIGDNGQLIGQIGIEPSLDKVWNEKLSFKRKVGFIDAGLGAIDKVWHVSALSLKFVGRMILGTVSTDNLAGPVTIARLAGDSAAMGIIPYLELLVLISINLGIFNLLPIPVLDGGHLMYYVAELCRGRPLSLRTQIIGQKIGLAVLALVMVLALFNDFSRLFGG